MFETYAIYNRIKNKIYIGHSADLVSRLERHNKKLPSKIKSYTSKNNGDWVLIYIEQFGSRKESIRREKELKSYQGRKFIWKKINQGA